jgi:hypothetical protein
LGHDQQAFVLLGRGIAVDDRAATAAQSSYDPRFIQELIGGRAHEHPALAAFYGLKDGELDTPRAYRLFEEASPITSATADDPPLILFYSEPDQPLSVGAPPGRGIHHPRSGAALKARLEPMGVECVVRRRKDLPRQEDPKEAMFREMGDFFARHLTARAASRIEAGSRAVVDSR